MAVKDRYAPNSYLGTCIKVRPAISAMLLVVSLLTLSGCGGGRETARQTVFVSVAPQASIVRSIGDDLVQVEILVASGQSPATYDPTPQQMARLTRAKVYFRVGVPFEAAFIDNLSAQQSELRIVDTRENVPLRYMESHAHGSEDDHEHHDHAGQPDPHIWLDPALVKIQAETVCRSLSELDPKHAASFRANLGRYHAQLDSLDALLRKLLAPVAGRRMYVFHPSYGYFAERYGLVQTAIETEGKEPSARGLAGLIEQARADSVQVLFVQPQFSRKTAQAIAQALGCDIVPLDPLAENLITNLPEIAREVARALMVEPVE